MNNFNLEKFMEMERLLDEAVPYEQQIYGECKMADGLIRIESVMNDNFRTGKITRSHFVQIITSSRTKHDFDSLEEAYNFVVQYHKETMALTPEDGIVFFDEED